MQYNFVADSIHTKKLCSRLSSSEMRWLTETAILRCRPILGAALHLELISKRVVDFLLVMNFYRQVLQLRRYEWKSTENRLFRRNGVSLGQHFTEKGLPPVPPTFFLSPSEI